MVSRLLHVSVSGESDMSSVSCPCSVSCDGAGEAVGGGVSKVGRRPL